MWVPTKSIRMVELVNDIIADGNNPVLTGVEITREVISDNKVPANTFEFLQGSEIANRARYFGLGTFKKDKLAGWLSEDEARATIILQECKKHGRVWNLW